MIFDSGSSGISDDSNDRNLRTALRICHCVRFAGSLICIAAYQEINFQTPTNTATKIREEARRFRHCGACLRRALINGITAPCGPTAIVARSRFRVMAGHDPRSTVANSAGALIGLRAKPAPRNSTTSRQGCPLARGAGIRALNQDPRQQ